MIPESYIEKLLGRPMENSHKLIYEKYKNNHNYKFIVDQNGNLKAVKQ